MPARLDIAANRSARKYTSAEMVRRILWTFGQVLFRFSPRLCLAGGGRCCGVSVRRLVSRYIPILPRGFISRGTSRVGDWSAIGEEALIYNLGPVTIGARATISHRAHLCAGTHDYTQPDLPLLKPPITIGGQAWVCADAFVGPNVMVGEGAVVGARAVVVRNVEPWTVVAGNPARMIKRRELQAAWNVSILILTLNEETNLPHCLQSVDWSDDIVVLDSFSADRTPEIARQCGATVMQRKFDNWAAHQNWAMANIPFKHSWVFYLDADERMTAELRDEICQISAASQRGRVAFYCGRKNYFMGKWIKHAYPPSLLMRFFRPRSVRFERLVNPTPVINGKHGYLPTFPGTTISAKGSRSGSRSTTITQLLKRWKGLSL